MTRGIRTRVSRVFLTCVPQFLSACAAPSSHLSFTLFLALSLDAKQSASISNVIASRNQSSSDFASQVQLKWSLLSSSRHWSLVETLDAFLVRSNSKIFFFFADLPKAELPDFFNFFQVWWTTLPQSKPQPKPAAKKLHWVPKRVPVSLPNDIIGLITSQLGDLEYLRLALCSHSWNSALDNEKAWQKRWFEGSHILSSLSLSSCDSFKARFRLIHTANRNIRESKGLIYQAARYPENISANVDWYRDLASLHVPVGSPYLTYGIVATCYGGGSYMATKRIQSDIVDISNFPTSAKRLSIPTQRFNCDAIAHQFACTSRRKSIDLHKIFAAQKEVAATPFSVPIRRLKTDLTNDQMNNSRDFYNANSSFPWAIYSFIDVQNQCCLTVYDINTGERIVKNQSLNEVSHIMHFYGPYLIAGTLEKAHLWKVDVQSACLAYITSAQKATSTIKLKCHNQTINNPITMYNGDVVFILPPTDACATWCTLEDLEHYSVEELHAVVFESNFIRLPTIPQTFAISGKYGAFYADSKLSVMDLETKQIVSDWTANDGIRYLRWIDSTLLCLELRHGILLLDFAARSPVTRQPQLTAAPTLPVIQPTFALIVSENSQRKVIIGQLQPYALGATLAFYFGESWASALSLNTLHEQCTADAGLDCCYPTFHIFAPRDGKADAENVKAFVDWFDRADLSFALNRDTSSSSDQSVSTPTRPTHSRNRYLSPRPGVAAIAEVPTPHLVKVDSTIEAFIFAGHGRPLNAGTRTTHSAARFLFLVDPSEALREWTSFSSK